MMRDLRIGLATVVRDQPSTRWRRAPAQSTDKGWVSLFNGKDLTGWKNYGVEKWTVDNGEILGEAVTKAYGYLGTEKTYTNFEMKGKFKAEGSGNSGIFYHATVNGTDITGVQVEVDPRPNMHTGGLYETGGREWLGKFLPVLSRFGFSHEVGD